MVSWLHCAVRLGRNGQIQGCVGVRVDMACCLSSGEAIKAPCQMLTTRSMKGGIPPPWAADISKKVKRKLRCDRRVWQCYVNIKKCPGKPKLAFCLLYPCWSLVMCSHTVLLTHSCGQVLESYWCSLKKKTKYSKNLDLLMARFHILREFPPVLFS